MNSAIETLITDTNNPIVILSGEGEYGTYDLYTGKRTLRAIRGAVTRAKSKGDRWARAIVYSNAAGGGVYAGIVIDDDTMEYTDFPSEFTSDRVGDLAEWIFRSAI